MCSLGIVKRVIPFFATLVIGLFLASFFVDLAPRPLFMEGRRHRCQDLQNLYLQERDRRVQAEQELDRIRQHPINLSHTQPWEDLNEAVPPVPIQKAPRSVR
jgi:hypothetical protein